MTIKPVSLSNYDYQSQWVFVSHLLLQSNKLDDVITDLWNMLLCWNWIMSNFIIRVSWSCWCRRGHSILNLPEECCSVLQKHLNTFYVHGMQIGCSCDVISLSWFLFDNKVKNNMFLQSCPLSSTCPDVFQQKNYSFLWIIWSLLHSGPTVYAISSKCWLLEFYNFVVKF